MKSKKEKRLEALGRMMKYSYENSKAKRKGVSEGEWKKANKARREHVMKLAGVRS